MVTLAPAASGAVNVQVRLPVAVAGQPALAGALTVQVPGGSGLSVTATPVAAFGPALLTVIMNVATSPGNSGPLPVLLMWTSAHCTVIVALASLSVWSARLSLLA